MSEELRERVAVLEEQQRQRSVMDAQVLDELKAIRTELTRYKGFIGGIAFVVSGTITLLVLVKGWLIGK